MYRVRTIKIHRRELNLALEWLGFGCEASPYDFLCLVDDFSVLANHRPACQSGGVQRGVKLHQALDVGAAMRGVEPDPVILCR
jgi:hypothetical protein